MESFWPATNHFLTAENAESAEEINHEKRYALSAKRLAYPALLCGKRFSRNS